MKLWNGSQSSLLPAGSASTTPNKRLFCSVFPSPSGPALLSSAPVRAHLLQSLLSRFLMVQQQSKGEARKTVLICFPKSWWPCPAELSSVGRRKRHSELGSLENVSLSLWSRDHAGAAMQQMGGEQLVPLLQAQLALLPMEDCLDLFSQVPVALPC